MIFLSLIIPLYNEENRLSKSLTKISQYFSKQKYAYEVIFVNDGSKYATLELIEKLVKNKPEFKLISNSANWGKGNAIKKGMLQAKGKYVIFTDIDLSTPLEELPKLITKLENCNVAVGVRRHKQSQVLKHQSFIREFLGQCFTIMTKMLVGKDIIDATCGFKGFRKTVKDKIFNQMKVNRWAFDAEILYLAKKYHYKIGQVPVIWKNDTGTKVNMIRDGVGAFVDLIRIKMWDVIGEYKS